MVVWQQWRVQDLPLSPPKGGSKMIFQFFGIKLNFNRIKSATKFRCVKTSSGKVVEQSISYEITEKYRTESVSFHLKYWLKLTYTAVAWCINVHASTAHAVTTLVTTKEYLSRVAARVETNGPAGYQQQNLGQMCHALVCRRTESAGSTMPLISLELSDTESWNFTHIQTGSTTLWGMNFFC